MTPAGPICDLEAERAVLGVMLINPDAVHDVLAAVTGGDFYRHAHRVIFEAMRALAERKQPIDTVTLRGSLSAAVLEDVGGPAYLASLGDGIPRSINVSAYCQMVKGAALRRRLHAIATQVIAEAQDAGIDAQAAVERAETAILDVGRATVTGEPRSIEAALAATWPAIEQAVDEGRPAVGLLTGLVDLDRMTHGMHAGNLIILAARPGMGKSALALTIADAAARSRDEAVAFFSLEMSEEELSQRLVGALGRIDMHRLMGGKSDAGMLQRLATVRADLGGSRLLVDDTAAQTVASIRSKARRIQATRGLSLIVLDYIQLLSSERRFDNRVVEVGAMSRGLKQLAGELHVPILALSQLNRGSEARSESKPRMSDLRESGSLEQDANAVWLLHRPEEYQATPDNAGIAELIIAKNRKGPTGLVTLRWSAEHTRFDSMSERVAS